MKSSWAYLLAPFFGWLVAQIMKNMVGAVSKQHGGIEKYMSSGGMPSAHTATVMALAVVVFVRTGISDLFAITVVLAAITIYDALVARRSIGEQGEAVVKLLKKSPFAKDRLPRVALGHKPLEVIAGGIVGAAVGWIVALFITI